MFGGRGRERGGGTTTNEPLSFLVLVPTTTRKRSPAFVRPTLLYPPKPSVYNSTAIHQGHTLSGLVRMSEFGALGAKGAGGGEPDQDPASGAVSSIKKRFEQLAATSKVGPPAPAPKPKLLSLASSTSSLRSVTSSPDLLGAQAAPGPNGNARNGEVLELGGAAEKKRLNLQGMIPPRPSFPPRPTSSARSTSSDSGGVNISLDSISISTPDPPIAMPSIPHSTRPPPATKSTSSYRKAPPPPASRKSALAMSNGSNDGVVIDDSILKGSPGTSVRRN